MVVKHPLERRAKRLGDLKECNWCGDADDLVGSRRSAEIAAATISKFRHIFSVASFFRLQFRIARTAELFEASI